MRDLMFDGIVRIEFEQDELPELAAVARRADFEPDPRARPEDLSEGHDLHAHEFILIPRQGRGVGLQVGLHRLKGRGFWGEGALARA